MDIPGIGPGPEVNDEWGVLGKTKCPLCRNLRKDPVFCVLWIGGILLILWTLGKGSE
jgi:hypothetical protein